MRAKKYLNILPDRLIQMDVTEAWGNRHLKEWIKRNIPLYRDKILWGRAKKSKQERGLHRAGRQQHQGAEQTEGARKRSSPGGECAKNPRKNQQQKIYTKMW